jgi:two-component system, OmpR family, response regulator QseB
MTTLILSDPDLSAALLRELRLAGQAACCAATYEVAWHALRTQSCNLLLLDLTQEHVECERLLYERRQQAFSCPVVALIDQTFSLADRARAVQGADCLMTKPVSLFEIVCHLKIYSRPSQSGAYFQQGDLRVDWRRRCVYIGTTRFALTPREFVLLVALVSEPDRVFSRAELVAGLNKGACPNVGGTVDVLLHRLREKIGKQRILNVRGRGFCLAPEQNSHDLPTSGGRDESDEFASIVRDHIPN